MQAIISIVNNNNIQRALEMGCMSSTKEQQRPVKSGDPVVRTEPQPKPQQQKSVAYRSPPSTTIAYTPAQTPLKPTPVQFPRQPIAQDEGGYPDVNNYGNAKANYMHAASRQTTDILKDQDYGYYAANGRNISMRVDLNN